jgi:hypothetical protein
MKYRIVRIKVADRFCYEIQSSRFGIFWTWRSQENDFDQCAKVIAGMRENENEPDRKVVASVDGVEPWSRED